jgi:hypothetical protein
MKKQLMFSKIVHWIAILCLLLPFFYTGCDREKKAKEPIAQDTSLVVAEDTATVVIPDTPAYAENPTPEPKDTAVPTHSDKSDDLLSNTLSERYPWLKPVLIPKEDTSTGLAVVLDSGPFIPLFAPFVFLLILLLGLLTKYLNNKALNIHLVMDLTALVALVLAKPMAFHAERLWGFWVAVGFTGVMTLLDLWLLLNIRRNQVRQPEPETTKF